jgi:hypothetical protein
MLAAALAQQSILAQHQAQQALFKQQREQAQAVSLCTLTSAITNGARPVQAVAGLDGAGADVSIALVFPMDAAVAQNSILMMMIADRKRVYRSRVCWKLSDSNNKSSRCSVHMCEQSLDHGTAFVCRSK